MDVSGQTRGRVAPEVSTLVDLTQPIVTGMPWYPRDPQVSVQPALTVQRDGVNVLAIGCGSHSGTHVDAPFHVRDDLPDLDAVPLDRFAGPAVLVDAHGLAPRTPIGPHALDGVRDLLAPGVVVLLVTGWSRHWGDAAAYLAHPWPTPELAAELVAAGVRTVGIDALSVDLTPDDPATAALTTHLVLAESGAVIAENLTRLESLLAAQHRGRPVSVSLLPLRIGGGDGSPVRAVAHLGAEPDDGVHG